MTCCCASVCLGSHRVGINNPNSENPRIPQNLRTCVQGDPSLVNTADVCVEREFEPLLCFQRSVTSVCRCRVIGRVTSAAWTVRGPTPACASRGGGVSAATRVSERFRRADPSVPITRVHDSVCSQILMSVKTQNSLRAAARRATTSPGASRAAARRASTRTTTSTASVSITDGSQVSFLLLSPSAR